MATGLRALGIDRDIAFVDVGALHEVRSPLFEKPFVMPHGFDAARSASKAQFPQQAAGIEQYFERIDAMSFALAHDDGQSSWAYDQADVILVGVSRTSKTPTSIYLANRGVRTANVPLVPGIPLPHQLETLKKPLVVSLHATPERLIQVRQNRLLSMGSDTPNDEYIDRQSVTDEVAYARKLSAKFSWAQLDVTRRSIEETAAAIRGEGGTAVACGADVSQWDEAGRLIFSCLTRALCAA